MKKEILYGIHPVREALKAGRRKFFELFAAKEKHSNRLDEITSAAQGSHIPVRRISKAELAKLTESDMHQGVGAVVSEYPMTSLSDMFSSVISAPEDRFFLLSDHIADPHNFGALIRTAVCAGVNGIIVPKDRSANPSPTVSKVSAGALEHAVIAQATNIAAVMKELKEQGVWIAGLDPESPQSVFNSDLSLPLALVIGGEEKGIRPLVRSHCDFLVSIPQKGMIGSLNASAAGAIAMYEVYRQRELKKASVTASAPIMKTADKPDFSR